MAEPQTTVDDTKAAVHSLMALCDGRQSGGSAVALGAQPLRPDARLATEKAAKQSPHVTAVAGGKRTAAGMCAYVNRGLPCRVWLSVAVLLQGAAVRPRNWC